MSSRVLSCMALEDCCSFRRGIWILKWQSSFHFTLCPFVIISQFEKEKDARPQRGINCSTDSKYCVCLSWWKCGIQCTHGCEAGKSNLPITTPGWLKEKSAVSTTATVSLGRLILGVLLPVAGRQCHGEIWCYSTDTWQVMWFWIGWVETHCSMRKKGSSTTWENLKGWALGPLSRAYPRACGAEKTGRIWSAMMACGRYTWAGSGRQERRPKMQENKN